MSEHTPGVVKIQRHDSERYDWKYGIALMTDRDGQPNTVIANVIYDRTDTSVANAERLALCCNAHAPLVAALNTLLTEYLSWWPGCLECECGDDEHCLVCRGEVAIQQARAALSLAKGGGS